MTILDSMRISDQLNELNINKAIHDKDEARVEDILKTVGITKSQYVDWVRQYSAWYAEGCRLAEFTVAYGYPPDQSDRTRDLLALVAPYGLALRTRIIYDAHRDPHQLLISTYYHGDMKKAEDQRVRMALSRMVTR